MRGDEDEIMEDHIMEEIELWQYYLSKEEFSDCMHNFDAHKSKYEAVFEKSICSKRVFSCYVDQRYGDYYYDGNGSSLDLTDEECQEVLRNKEGALCSIEEYFAKRSSKRKVVSFGINNEEDFINVGFSKEMKEEVVIIKECNNNLEMIDEVKPIKRLRVVINSGFKGEGSKKTRVNKKVKKNDRIRVKRVKRVFDVPEVNELPREYIDRIIELNGRNVELIAQKALTSSDIDAYQNRLLLNHRCLRVSDFLRPDEEDLIKTDNVYLKTKLLEPVNRNRDISMNKLKMGKNLYYSLLTPWKEVVANNGFAIDDVVQVWSFRFDAEDQDDKLGIAVVRIFKAPREKISSTSGDSTVVGVVDVDAYTGEGDGAGVEGSGRSSVCSF